MELRRALLLSRRGIFRSANPANDHRSKRQAKKKSKVMGALEMAKGQGLVYEQTKDDINGVIRIRMVVKRSDLEKLMLMHVDESDGYDDVSLPSLVEQRLKQLRRKHCAKGISWTPALRSIPEEF